MTLWFRAHFDHGPPAEVEARDAEEARRIAEDMARADGTRLRKLRFDRRGGELGFPLQPGQPVPNRVAQPTDLVEMRRLARDLLSRSSMRLRT